MHFHGPVPIRDAIVYQVGPCAAVVVMAQVTTSSFPAMAVKVMQVLVPIPEICGGPGVFLFKKCVVMAIEAQGKRIVGASYINPRGIPVFQETGMAGSMGLMAGDATFELQCGVLKITFLKPAGNIPDHRFTGVDLLIVTLSTQRNQI